MRIASRIIVAACLIITLSGCESWNDLAQDLEGQAEATFFFWARLQGFQHRGDQGIRQWTQANLGTARSGDFDGTAEGFSQLSQTHDHMARQLQNLDTADVDPIAIDYRDRLVAAHQELVEEYRLQATATQNRDLQQIEERRPFLKESLIKYRDLSKEKDEIMSQLTTKYDRDFNAMD